MLFFVVGFSNDLFGSLFGGFFGMPFGFGDFDHGRSRRGEDTHHPLK